MLVETRLVTCRVEPGTDEIEITESAPELDEVIRRGNEVPHASGVDVIKVVVVHTGRIVRCESGPFLSPKGFSH